MKMEAPLIDNLNAIPANPQWNKEGPLCNQNTTGELVESLPGVSGRMTSWSSLETKPNCKRMETWQGN